MIARSAVYTLAPDLRALLDFASKTEQVQSNSPVHYPPELWQKFACGNLTWIGLRESSDDKQL